MPQFSPGQSKNAIVPATVTPGGLSCQLEVFLGPNSSTKVATSGLKSFTSTGAQQMVRCPIVMPAAGGAYHVYIDLYVAGYYRGGYQSIEDVTIVVGKNLVINSVTFTGSGIQVAYTINEQLDVQPSMVISAIEWVSSGDWVIDRGHIYVSGNLGSYSRFISTPGAASIDIVQFEWGNFNLAHPTIYWYLPLNREITGDEYTRLFQERFGY